MKTSWERSRGPSKKALNALEFGLDPVGGLVRSFCSTNETFLKDFDYQAHLLKSQFSSTPSTYLITRYVSVFNRNQLFHKINIVDILGITNYITTFEISIAVFKIPL